MGNPYLAALVDGTWNNPLNWTTVDGVTPYGSIPLAGDYVRYISTAILTTGPSVAITLLGYDDTGGADTGVDLSNILLSNGTLVFVAGGTWNGNYSGTLTATFDNSSTCSMNIGTGVTASFNDGSLMTGNISGGTINFLDPTTQTNLTISGGIQNVSAGGAISTCTISGATQNFTNGSGSDGCMISGGTQTYDGDSATSGDTVTGGTQIFADQGDFASAMTSYLSFTGNAFSFDGGTTFFYFQSLSTDPGISKVLAPTTYSINGVSYTGTASSGGSGKKNLTFPLTF